MKSIQSFKPTVDKMTVKYPGSNDPILDDNGNEVKLHIGSMLSKQYRETARDFYKDAGEETVKSANPLFEPKLLAGMVEDWEPTEFWDPNGDGAFTVDKMAAVLDDYYWLIGQVQEAVLQKDKKFLGPSAASNGGAQAQNQNGVSGQQREQSSKSAKSSKKSVQ